MTIAVPAQRKAHDPVIRQGEELFRAMGCASCHMPTLQTKSVEHFSELANQTFHPFTDLLLHDMGEGLADNRPDFEATGREWRTPPLWGLGLIPVVNKHDLLLHDGRARGACRSHSLARRRSGKIPRGIPQRRKTRTRCADRLSQFALESLKFNNPKIDI